MKMKQVWKSFKSYLFLGLIMLALSGCVPTSVTIVFDSNGGSEVASITQTPFVAITPPADPTRDGYTFAGWYTEESLTNLFSFSTAPSTNLTLFAKWTPNPYTIHFETDGGTPVGDLTQDFDTAVAAPTPPTKAGYTFVGWYTEAELTNVYSFSTMPASDLTLYAKWSIQINFETNGGTPVSPISEEPGSPVTAPLDPTRPGYTFSGWYGEAELTNPYVFATMPAGSITVYAKWTVNAYTLHFEENGGSEVGDITADFGSGLMAPADPEKPGYTFGGWFSDLELTLPYAFTTMPAEDLTLYAKWIPTASTLHFEVNGGTEVADITQGFGTVVSAPAPPEKNGYSFAGWYADVSLETPYVFSTMPAEDVTVYAKWIVNQYTLGFEENGGTVVPDITQDFGSPVTAPAEPLKTGYAFSGWYADAGLTVPYAFTAMPGENATVYARWTVNQYTITFHSLGGNEITALSGDFGSPVTAPADPTRMEHDFAGWYTEIALTNVYSFTTMPAADLDLYAKWILHQYTIAFEENGGSAIVDMTQDFGSATSAPTDPLKDGYSFGGWYADAELTVSYVFSTMPNQNLVVYAKWIPVPAQSTISFVSNGGTPMAPITQDEGSAVTAPADPFRDGYVFTGWYTDPELSIPYVFATMPADDLTLYAAWTIESSEADYFFSALGSTAYMIVEYNGEGGAITLPSTHLGLPVTQIGHHAFAGCSKLTAVFIPSGITEIGDRAFYNCENLSSVSIPDSVLSLGEGIFALCPNLASLSLPFVGSSRTATEAEALFGYIFGTFDYAGATPCRPYGSQDPLVYYLPSVLRTVVLNDQETLPVYAFRGCTTLTEITLPPNLITISPYAFAHCTGLIGLSVPSRVTDIGAFAFYGCKDLTTVSVGIDVENIGMLAFWYCTSLTAINVVSGNFAYSSVDGVLYDSSRSDLLVYPEGKTNLEFIVPSTVSSIGDYAFFSCQHLQSLLVPEDHPYLSSLDGVLYSKGFFTLLAYPTQKAGTAFPIPDTVMGLGETAFCGNTRLESILIPQSVSAIDHEAFWDCTGLREIVLPENLTTIGDYAFQDCRNLRLIVIPLAVSGMGSEVFYECPDLVIYAEAESRPAGWNEFWENGNSQLVWGFDPDTQSAIAFQSNGGSPAAVIWGDEGTAVQAPYPPVKTDFVFAGWYADPELTSFYVFGTMPEENVVLYAKWVEPGTENPDWIFTLLEDGTYGIAGYLGTDPEVLLPSQHLGIPVTAIGPWAFCIRTDLSRITIPSGITTIGDGAFQNCTSLRELILPATVLRVGSEIFDASMTLVPIYVEAPEKPAGWAETWAGAMFWIFYGFVPSETDFRYTVSSGNATICGYVGTDVNVVVPAVIDGYPVVNLAKYAFRNQYWILTVTLPEGILSIPRRAFDSCTSLVSVNIPDSVTSIAYGAFLYCTSLRELRIPENVTSIGDYAFDYCDHLQVINIPESVTTLGAYAFVGCGQLTIYIAVAVKPSGWNLNWNTESGSVEVWGSLPPERSTITFETDGGSGILPITQNEGSAVSAPTDPVKDGYEFAGWFSNPERTVPYVFSIMPEADLTLYAKWVLPQDGESFDTAFSIVAGTEYRMTFTQTYTITYLVFTPLTSGTHALYTKGYLDTIGFLYDHSRILIEENDNGRPLGNMLILEDLVAGETYYLAIDVPASPSEGEFNFAVAVLDPVTGMVFTRQSNATYNLSLYLGTATTLAIPAEYLGLPVVRIGMFAFYDSDTLETLTIPEGITRIDQEAFRNCSSLRSVAIPASAATIGMFAFADCPLLDTVLLAEGLTTLGAWMFENDVSLSDVVLPSTLQNIPAGLFAGCSSLQSLLLPAPVSSFGEYAFKDCSSMTEIVIPLFVTLIGGNAFKGCSSLTIRTPWASAPVSWLEGWNVDDRPVVWGWTNQATITFDANGGSAVSPITQTVGTDVSAPGDPTRADYAFDGWYLDAELTIPYVFTIMPAEDLTLFAGWIALLDEGLVFTLQEDDTYFVTTCTSTARKILIPAAYLGIPVTGIGVGAFSALMDLESIVIPASVLTIGDYPFWECRSLSTILLDPANPAFSLHDGVLFNKDKTSLLIYPIDRAGTSYVIPEGVTSIGYGAFQNTLLTSITIPEGVVVIGPMAFERCGGLTEIFLPSSVTTIGAGAFYLCSNLQDITIPEGVTRLEEKTFYGAGITSVTLPSGLSFVAIHAFAECRFLTEVRIPAGVTVIRWNAFLGCESLTIYPEIAEKPFGWDADWNVDDRPVVWGTVPVPYSTISFIENGAESPVPFLIRQEGSPIAAPADPTRTGYVFAGWFINYELTEPYVFATMPEEDLALYAKWTAGWFWVCFDENGGLDVPDIHSEYGTAFDNPVAIREGYTFAGWYTDYGFLYGYGMEITTVEGFDLALIAKWTVNSYTLVFEENGGTEIPDLTADFGSPLGVTEPTRTGHSFEGWYRDAELTDLYGFFVDSVPAENLTLYAKWTVNMYWVSFDVSGGSEILNIYEEYGTEIGNPVTTREGYTFAGWYTDYAYEAFYGMEITTVEGYDLVLIAKWTVNNYTLSFEENGGSDLTDLTQAYGSDLSAPAEPVRTGYDFAGWYLDADFTAVYEFTTMPSGDFTVYLKWERIPFESDPIQSMSCKYYSVLALTVSGKVFSWGQNAYGQVGDGTTTNRSLPVDITEAFGLQIGETIVQVVTGNQFALALTSTGRIFAWGINAVGQFGNNTTTNSSVPLDVTGNFSLNPGETLVFLETGPECGFALTSDHRIFSWGNNTYGALARGNTTASLVPIDVTSHFALNAGETILTISAGSGTVMALTSDHRLFAWGNNYWGTFGTGSTGMTNSTPVVVGGGVSLNAGETIVDVILGEAQSHFLTSEGRVFSTGHNITGCVGVGSGNNVVITWTCNNNSMTLEAGETIAELHPGAYFCVVVTTNGRVFIWGDDTADQQATSAKANNRSPVDVTSAFGLATGETVEEVWVCGSHGYLLTSLGRILVWGDNAYGQFGDGTTTDQTAPVALVE